MHLNFPRHIPAEYWNRRKVLFQYRSEIPEHSSQILQEVLLLLDNLRISLDVNWILDAEIPENIIQIHKEIKAAGFLK